MGIDAGQSLAELVVEDPERGRLFERLGIDFCCGGKHTLAEACAEQGLDVESVMRALDAFDALQDERRPADRRDWSQASLTELCDHIEQVHHQYLRDHLPRLASLVGTVHRVHGARHSELSDVAALFADLDTDLRRHIELEERDVFTVIRQLEPTGEAPADERRVAAALALMQDQHRAVGEALKRLRRLTRDFDAPEDACHTYRTMLAELSALESDLHEHIHKENNILFPRAVEQLGA